MIDHIGEKHNDDINIQKYSYTFEVAGGLPGRPECQYVNEWDTNKEILIEHFSEKFKRQMREYLTYKQYKISDFL